MQLLLLLLVQLLLLLLLLPPRAPLRPALLLLETSRLLELGPVPLLEALPSQRQPPLLPRQEALPLLLALPPLLEEPLALPARALRLPLAQGQQGRLWLLPTPQSGCPPNPMVQLPPQLLPLVPTLPLLQVAGRHPRLPALLQAEPV